MGNNVTRNGKDNNSPTFKKSLLAASFAVAMAGFAMTANAATQSLTVTTSGQTVDSTADNTSPGANTVAGTLAYNEDGTINILHSFTGGAGADTSTAPAAISATVTANKAGVLNITGDSTTPKSIIGGAGDASTTTGDPGGAALVLLPAAGTTGTTKLTVTIADAGIAAITGGAGGANNGAGAAGGDGGAAVSLTTVAKLESTITVNNAITGGAGGASNGAFDGGTGGAGIVILENTSDAATKTVLNVAANVSGGKGGTGTAQDGLGGAGISSAQALGTVTIDIAAGKTLAAGVEGGTNTNDAGTAILITSDAVHTITNAGTITSTATTAAQGNHAINNTGTSNLTITNTGTISTNSTDGTTHNAIRQNTAGVLSVTNSGTISTAGADAIEKGAGAGSVTIDNQLGGTISSTTDAISVVAGGADAASTITNAGTITGNILYADIDTKLTITSNSGTITGNVTGDGGGLEITSNSGTITGNVTTGANNGALTITNSGTITGALSVDGTGDLVLANSGTVTGTFTGGSDTGDSLTMSGTSKVTGAVSATETITVSGGATATFGSTIDTTPTAVNVGAASATTTAIFQGAVSSDVTGTAGSEKLQFNVAPGANIAVDSGDGIDTLSVGNLSLDLEGETQNLDPDNFEKLEVGANSQTTTLSDNVLQVSSAKGNNITDFTILSGGVLDANGKTVDSQNITIKGKLVTNGLVGTARSQTFIIDALSASTDTQGQAIDGNAGVNTLTVRAGNNTATVDAISNMDTLTVESGTLEVKGAVALTGANTFNLNANTKLAVNGGSISATTSNLNGELLTAFSLASTPTSTVNIGTTFNSGSFALLDDSGSDADVLNVTGAADLAGTRPQLFAVTDFETINSSGVVDYKGAVTGVDAFNNSGTAIISGAGFTADAFTNSGNGVLNVQSTAATITTLTPGSGGIVFGGSGTATATPVLTVTNALTNAGALSVKADTDDDQDNTSATLIAPAGLTQTGAMTFEAYSNLNDATNDAQLTITSNSDVDLSGATLKVLKPATSGSNKQFIAGETVAVIDATGVTGTYTEPTVKTDAVLLPLAVSTAGNITTITANGASQNIKDVVNPAFATFAQAFLDDYSSATTGLDNSEVLSNATLDMDKATLDTFMDQITPDRSGSTTQGVISALNTYAGSGGVLQNRVTAVQGMQVARVDGAGIATGSGPMKLSNHGVWGEVFGGKVEDDGRDGTFGYDADTYGATIGADTQIGRHFTLGMALAYAKTDVDTKTRIQKTHVKSYLGSLYMGVSAGQFFLNANVAYGLNQYDYTNQITTGVPQTINAEYNGNVFSTNAAAGFSIPLTHALSLTPLGSVSYTYVNAEEYTESSSVTTGSAAQIINQEPVHSVRVGAGARLAYAVRSGENTFVPSLQLMAYHQTGNRVDSRTVLVGTAGSAASNGILVEGVDPNRNIISAQAGLAMKFGKHLGVSLTGTYDHESDSKAYSGSLKVRYNF